MIFLQVNLAAPCTDLSEVPLISEIYPTSLEALQHKIVFVFRVNAQDFTEIVNYVRLLPYATVVQLGEKSFSHENFNFWAGRFGLNYLLLDNIGHVRFDIQLVLLNVIYQSIKNTN